ncbi:MAG: hypothetical protein HYX76_14790 [Acidobacteria bacterium]|nr:hypothetical protein [Acidobacteriota bacterium]
MRLIFSLPAMARRPALVGFSFVTFSLVMTLGAFGQASGQPAQQPSPQTTEPSQPTTQPQAQAPAARTFSADAGMMFNVIKADKTADFEMVMGRLKDALQKSEDPARKQQAASWKVFRSLEPGPSGNVLYIFIMDPAVKGADYTVSKILSEAFPTEVQDLYKKYSEAYAGGQNIVNLQLVQALGAPAAAEGK